jgi:ribosome maturation factor RimP
MAKKSVTEIVEDLISAYVEKHNMELVDVEFVKEGPHRYLRVFIDKDEEKISLADCKLVSDYINERIDSIDPIKENYFLEVSSPGIERPLKKPRDFEKNIGQTVQAKLFSPFEGQKIIDGILKSFDDETVTISIKENEVITIPRDKISLIKPIIQI